MHNRAMLTKHLYGEGLDSWGDTGGGADRVRRSEDRLGGYPHDAIDAKPVEGIARLRRARIARDERNQRRRLTHIVGRFQFQ